MIIPKLQEFKPVEFITEITYCDNKYGCKDLVCDGFDLSVHNPGELEHYNIETEPRRGWDVFNQFFLKDYPVYIAANATIKEVFNGQVVFESTFSDMSHDKALLKKYCLDGVITNEILLHNIRLIESEFWKEELAARDSQMDERE